MKAYLIYLPYIAIRWLQEKWEWRHVGRVK